MYPLTIFQNPHRQWEFIISLEPYFIPLERDNFYPHQTSEIYAISYEINEGDENYDSYSQFTSRLYLPFNFNFHFNHNNTEISKDEAFRYLFQVLRHPEQNAIESITDWAIRLHKNNLFPITDDFINNILNDYRKFLKDVKEGDLSDDEISRWSFNLNF